MIDSSSVLRRSGDVRYRTIDREAVVVRQRQAEVLVLNEVAARVLDLADGTTPVAGWVEVLAAEYDVTDAELARDLVEFAGELAEAGILELVAPPGSGP